MVTLTAADGATADCEVPFPPLTHRSGAAEAGTLAHRSGAARAETSDDRVATVDSLDALVAHALTARRVGVLLVRLGGYAAGVFDGAELLVSKVDRRLVHGRNRAGGSSSTRFARRREGQARQLAEAAAEVACRVLLPHTGTLDSLVLGGDRRAVDAVLADHRLAVLRPLVSSRFLTVPDPRRVILDGTPALFRSVRIRLGD
jgi:hypothetical protein